MSKVKPRKAMVFEDKLENFSPKRKKHGLHVPKAVPCTIGDRLNIAILLFLYTLQGVPLGLSAAIPIIMQKKHITYKEQAQFSFSTWPFSLKLLWAPIVDSIFWPKFGRRKTWLVPVQYLIGFFLLFLAMNINDWLVFTEDPNTTFLTLMFFCLNFLAATQDIAVDGWALTMLRKENVGYASTCNSVGQTIGAFLGYVVFITLESPTFCNKWLRFTESTEGLITLQGFLYFWGYTFMIATTLVAIFKHENNESSQHDSHDLNLYQTYKLLGDIIKLPSVKTLSIILLTAKIGFSAIDVVSSLKIIDKGIPKDDIALIGLLSIPLQIIIPVLITKYTAGPKPMNIYLKSIPYRLLIGIVIAVIVYFTPYFIDQDGNVSMFYYILVLSSFLLHQLTMYSMFVAVMAFFARISDPLFGGTNMTLLNTLTNLGGAWANTAALWMTDFLTYKQCSTNENNTCSTETEINACQTSDGKCEITIDGFYLETFLCTIFGIMWYQYFSKIIRNLQSKDLKHWHVDAKKHSKL
ncbi:acetyl-coenzyme A transporter 1 [Acyrthosiphon pisum]|uniref:Acetyl-coenzyme A transporter 1 n=1 Tax=Acyrthosiphon pisum TaxID=7029 RepID=A0A8R1W2S6_ACYPI|nr:acetyl-coenzyme A transporter 1 [Acyrthosiphon pisum]XP_016660090.1 acetyl-coenzyme A transporter 1 [Acyrthosiphon pisum]|eukprot:XP_001947097.1 PREDICTED: acetyl-coenzyme A transporter 1 [Acyrthosiphon pisum]